METVLKRMSREKLIALGAMLNLHDQKNPVTPTFTYIATRGSTSAPSFQDLQVEEMAGVIAKEIASAGGHTIANIFRGGKGLPYREIVWDVAEHVKAELSPVDTVAEAEGKIAAQVLRTVLEKLTPEQKAELAQNLERLAKEHGNRFVTEGGVLTALTAAQLSGFAIYLAASTAVGAITGLLGITLPFACYTAITKAISVMIGPIGWSALGIALVYKAGSPNMKKLVPAVLFIAAVSRAGSNL